MNDIQELIERARVTASRASLMNKHRVSALYTELADALEALNRENEDQRRYRISERVGLVTRINDYRAERDALQAQLDGMTTEIRAHRLAISPKGKVVEGPLMFEERLVGPWEEVS